jgi:two-component system, LuxR family, sensor kinase FixL
MPANPTITDAKPASFELQALLDATVDAVMLIDSRGRLEVYNRSAERLFGYSAAEVLGRNVSILMTDVDRTQHDAYMERYHRTGVPHIIGSGREVDARRKDGSVFPAFLSVGRITNAEPPRYVGFIQDLTLRQQALAAVVRERDRANQYLEAAQTILVALDPERRVTLINRKGCEILGCAENALLGNDWFQSVVPLLERDVAAAPALQRIPDTCPRWRHTADRLAICRGSRRRGRGHGNFMFGR